MKSTIDSFKDGIDKAFTTQPNVKLNSDTMMDAQKYKSSFVEEIDSDGNEYETFLEKNKKSKNSAKNQFTKDIAKDIDYIGFKKGAEYKDEKGEVHSFGTPNAANNDPFVKKKKYSRVGKEESKEATGSGSSGAYSAPLFGEFNKESNSETPKLKESDVEKVEATEATTTGSSGAYESPSMWAKSTSKKDWGPSRKTQIPGGGFVKIKKKCTKFPYCNQGDINALKLSETGVFENIVDKLSKEYNLSKTTITKMINEEILKNIKK